MRKCILLIVLCLFVAVGVANAAAPVVDAGVNGGTIMPAAKSLDATITGGDGEVTILWTKVTGPGTAVFSDDAIEDPTVTLGTQGHYVLQVSADDGVNPAVTDTVSIRALPTGYAEIDRSGITVTDTDAGSVWGNSDALIGAGHISFSADGYYGTPNIWSDYMEQNAEGMPCAGNSVTFALGNPYDIDYIRVWNGSYAPDFGIATCNVLISDDGTNYTNLGSITLGIGQGNNDVDTSTVAAIDDSSFTGGITHVKLDYLTNHGNGTYYGMSEVSFSGEKIPTVTVELGENLGVLGSDILDVTPDVDEMGHTVNYEWSVIDGTSANVSFDPNAYVEDPNITFSVTGHYELQLDVNDITVSMIISDTVKVMALPAGYSEIDRSSVTVTDTDAGSVWGNSSALIGSDHISFSSDGYYGTYNVYGDYMEQNAEGMPCAGESVTFALKDGLYDIDYIRVWNGSYAPDFGIATCDVLISDDGMNYTNLGTITLGIGQSNNTVDSSTTHAVDCSSFPNGITHIKLDYLTNYGNASYYGMSEVYLSGEITNYAPVVDSTIDVGLIGTGNTAAMDANASDAESDPMTYDWAQISGPATVTYSPSEFVEDPTIGNLTAEGLYLLDVVANDGYSDSEAYPAGIKVLPSDYVEIDNSEIVDTDASTENGGGWGAIGVTIDESRMNYSSADGYYVKNLSNGDYGNTWLAASATVADQWAEFVLDKPHDLNYLRLWNLNYGGSNEWGVKGFKVYGKVNAGDSYVEIGDFTTATASAHPENEDPIASDASELFALDCSSFSQGVKYIKIDILTRQDDVATGYVGFDHIKLSGYPYGCASLKDGDLDNSCDVGLDDVALMAGEWLNSVDPDVAGSDDPWTADLVGMPALLHRWSFNGDYTDSVGSATAVAGGDATITSNALDLTANPGNNYGEGIDPDNAGDPTATGASWAELPIASSLNSSLTNEITVMAWYYQPDSNSQTARLFELRGSSGADNVIIYVPTGNDAESTYAVYYHIDPDWSNSSTFIDQLDAGQWYHMALVFRSPGNDCYLYIDGEQVGSPSQTSNYDADDITYTAAYVGRVGGSYPYTRPMFKGLVDELRIYDAAMTAEQVKIAYAAGPDELTLQDCSDVIEAGYEPTYGIAGDCTLNLTDFAVLAADWLECTEINPGDCP